MLRTSLFALLLTICGTTAATTFTVGDTVDTACQYSSLRAALDVAQDDPNGPHLVKVALATHDSSLSYSAGQPDEAYYIRDPLDDITVEGGYAACGDTAPQTNAFTTIDYANASVDRAYTLLTIRNEGTNPRRVITLRNLKFLVPQAPQNANVPAYGGAIAVRENVEVNLDNVWIKNFVADYGAAVYATCFWDPQFGAAPTPAVCPELEVSGGSRLTKNVATSGGAIHAGNSRVILDGAGLTFNHASSRGGAISVLRSKGFDRYTALQVRSSPTPNIIAHNDAGSSGGAIYSSYGDITMDWYSYAQIYSNTAKRGGAIAVIGLDGPSGTPYAEVRIRDAVIGGNTATEQGGALYSADAVDWKFNSSGADHEYHGKVGPRMAFVNNEAQNAAGEDFGGGVAFITNSRNDGMSRGIIRFYRTWFIDNEDTGGGAAVTATTGASEVRFYRSIFDNNSAAGDLPAMIATTAVKNIDFNYNTVVSNNVDYLFMMAIGSGSPVLDLTGSILWSPGTDPAYLGTATTDSDRCLVAHTTTHLSWWIWVKDPELDNHYAPDGDSPAIDYCDSLSINPMPDIHWQQTAYDVPGVVARLSRTAPWNWDVGAVEQTDIIYANSFGNRPDN